MTTDFDRPARALTVATKQSGKVSCSIADYLASANPPASLRRKCSSLDGDPSDRAGTDQ